jgi:hypothetical protein
MPDGFPVRATRAEVTEHLIQAVGGSAAVTKVYGEGVAVTRTSSGLYLLTWAQNPGTFVGWSYAFAATTHADLDGFTAVRGVYNASAYTLAFSVYDATPTIADLAALNWIDIVCRFKGTAV